MNSLPRTARAAAAAAALSGLALLVTGCGGSASPSADSGQTGTAHSASHAPASSHKAHSSSTSNPSSSTGTTTTGTTTTGATGTGGATTGGATGGAAACTTADLRINADASQGWKGTFYDDVDFFNHGDQACTLYGYPGISFLGGQRNAQIGRAAVENSSTPRTLVTIEPGQENTAELEISQSDVPLRACEPKTATWMRVYPPNQGTPIQVPILMSICSGPINQSSVGTVRP
jgi:hypothetical protein